MDRDPGLNRPATRADIEQLFQLILGRAVGGDAYAREIEATGVTVGVLARALVESTEFQLRVSSGAGVQRGQPAVRDLDFEKPTTQSDVDELFRLILSREVGIDEYKRDVEASGVTVRDFARRCSSPRNSPRTSRPVC